MYSLFIHTNIHTNCNSIKLTASVKYNSQFVKTAFYYPFNSN